MLVFWPEMSGPLGLDVDVLVVVVFWFRRGRCLLFCIRGSFVLSVLSVMFCLLCLFCYVLFVLFVLFVLSVMFCLFCLLFTCLFMCLFVCLPSLFVVFLCMNARASVFVGVYLWVRTCVSARSRGSTTAKRKPTPLSKTITTFS